VFEHTPTKQKKYVWEHTPKTKIQVGALQKKKKVWEQTDKKKK
jgi:hypothetical protein